MKRKLSVLSVILALLALVLVFTACGATENQASESLNKPRTITIYSITGDNTTKEAIEGVQEAMNKITRSLYNIEVVLKLYPASEYEAALQAAIAANEEGTVGSEVVDTSEEVTADTIVNEYGRPITIYPEAYENQLDIFLIPAGVDKFDLYTTKYFSSGEGDAIEYSGVVTDLTELINQNSQDYVINQYIPEKVLNFCRKYTDQAAGGDNPLLGLPSNRYYGDAEYFLVNKALYAEYRYDPAMIAGVTDIFSGENVIKSFLVDLAADCGAGKRPGTIPLYNTPGMNLMSVTGANSVVAQAVSDTATVGPGLFTPMNIFSVPKAQQAMTFVNNVYMAGGIMPTVTKEVDFNKTFGAAFVYGSTEILSKYADDYYIIQTSVPKAEAEDIYEGVYAISKYAEEYADRCMHVLNALTTNAEYRNLFAYGVENVNYMVDEETGLITKNNVKPENVYDMDIYLTGNVFLVKQNDQMTEAEMILSANNWAFAKATNNLAIVSPYAKFTLNITADLKAAASDPSYKTVLQCIPELEKLYDEIWIWISEYQYYTNPSTGEPLNTFSQYLTVLQERLAKNLYVKSSVSPSTDFLSIRQQYANFHYSTYGEGKK